MLHIGRVGELVVIQITDAAGAVQAQTALTVETANIATKRIMDTVKEIRAAETEGKVAAKGKKRQ